MGKLLFYIDQSVLSLQVQGAIDLAKVSAVQWIYSTEHLAEIRRSAQPEKYLRALMDLNAKRLELRLEEFKITGEAFITEGVSPEEHFARYLEALSEVDLDEHMFDPLMAWINGGGDEDELRTLPQRIQAQLASLNDQLPEELRSEMQADPLAGMLDQLVEQGNDILKTRAALGGDKGRYGSVTGENPLQQIWEMARPSLGDATKDQFFGFEPITAIEGDAIPTFLGIARCCAILDILGFQAEKKIRNLAKLPNVRSDAAHIGMAAYCTAFVTADRRLAKRAKAIYELRKLGTVTLLFESVVPGQ
jgi:hypothetical protein